MPKVELLDWDKLKPRTPENKSTKHIRRKPSSYKPRKRLYRKRFNLKDKRLISSDVANRKHLNSIMREDF